MEFEQDQFARRRGPRRASRFVQQHERKQAKRFGFWQQIDEQPAQADGLTGQVVPRDRRA